MVLPIIEVRDDVILFKLQVYNDQKRNCKLMKKRKFREKERGRDWNCETMQKPFLALIIFDGVSFYM